MHYTHTYRRIRVTCRVKSSACSSSAELSSISPPFNLDSSLHTLLWDSESSFCTQEEMIHHTVRPGIHKRTNVNVLARLSSPFNSIEITYSLFNPFLLTSLLCTALCDWLKDFCSSWRRVSDVWTWVWSTATYVSQTFIIFTSITTPPGFQAEPWIRVTIRFAFLYAQSMHIYTCHKT